MYVSDIPYLHPGGASRSVQTLFRELAKRGHTCRAIVEDPSEKHITVDGVLCIRTKVPRQWASQILTNDKPNPKVILTQHIYDPWLFELAAAHKISVILRVPSWEHFCNDVIRFAVCGWDCESIKCNRRQKFSLLYKQASAIMSISEYVAGAVQRFYGRDSTIVRPLVDRNEYLVDARTKKYVTMVRGDPVKGADFFVEIAKRLPEVSFAIAGDTAPYIDDAIRAAPNMMAFGQKEDMRDVYSQTSIYLAPTIWAEPFGRTLVEAMMNGIPVIGSDRGAVPEVLGDSGIVLPLDVDQWVSTITKLLEDETFYGDVSDKCRIRAQAPEFDMGEQVSIFLNLAESLVAETVVKPVTPNVIVKKGNNKVRRIAFFGPWIGEFGWEAMSWQSWCRKESRRYEKSYVCSFPGMELFYEDFAEFIPHSDGIRELWGPDPRDIDFSKVKYTLPEDVSEQIMPIWALASGGEFIRFGSELIDRFSCLIHARGIKTHEQAFKNYPMELWERIAHELPANTACVGTSSDIHIKGTVDLRGISLKELANHIAGCKVMIGGSSGPMHFSCLCGAPMVVWGPRIACGGSLEERYKKIWNPFGTRVEYVCRDDWAPTPGEILTRVYAILGEPNSQGK